MWTGVIRIRLWGRLKEYGPQGRIGLLAVTLTEARREDGKKKWEATGQALGRLAFSGGIGHTAYLKVSCYI